MAVVGASHGEGSVHVNVVAGEVEGEQHLEDNGPSGECARQENQQTRSRASVRNHVENGAKARRLLESASSVSIESVKEARHAVQQRAGSRVEGHVVEGGDGEDNARVACEETTVRKDVVETCRAVIPMMLGQKRKMFS